MKTEYFLEVILVVVFLTVICQSHVNIITQYNIENGNDKLFKVIFTWDGSGEQIYDPLNDVEDAWNKNDNKIWNIVNLTEEFPSPYQEYLKVMLIKYDPKEEKSSALKLQLLFENGDQNDTIEMKISVDVKISLDNNYFSLPSVSCDQLNLVANNCSNIELHTEVVRWPDINPVLANLTHSTLNPNSEIEYEFYVTFDFNAKSDKCDSSCSSSSKFDPELESDSNEVSTSSKKCPCYFNLFMSYFSGLLLTYSLVKL